MMRAYRNIGALIAAALLGACSNEQTVMRPPPLVSGTGPEFTVAATGGPQRDTAQSSSGPVFSRDNASRASAALNANGAMVGSNASPYLVWQNTQTGERGFWTMSGTTYTGQWTTLGSVSPVWDISAIADFTCDGKPDLLWTNTQTGERGFWTMNGLTYTGQWTALAVVVNTWRIAAAADMNADGKADVIWENTQTGERGVWPMNCTTYTGTWAPISSVNTSWHISTAADFTADGKPDLVWQNTSTNETTIWQMNGTTYTGTQFDLGANAPQRQIVAAADFTCDGKPDLLWQNTTTGERFIWHMNGTTHTTTTSVSGVTPTWDIAGTLGVMTGCVQMTITSPTTNHLVGDTLTVAASALSGFQMSQVTARILSTQINLTYVPASQLWIGTIVLAGFPRGTLAVTVSGTDVAGGTGSATTTFIHDTPPVIASAAPTDSLVARPLIHVSATCADDSPNGCVSMRVRLGSQTGTVLASGTTSFDTDISLAANNGTSLFLVFEATDDAGQITRLNRLVYVESSASLAAQYTLPLNAHFLDVTGDSLLYGAPVGNGTEVRVHRITANTETTIGSYAGTTLGVGYLTPMGAVFSTPCSGGYCFALAANGTAVVFGSGNGIHVAGNIATWFSASNTTAYRRDFIAGTTVQLNGGYESATGVGYAAANGDVVYNVQYPVYVWRYRNGIRTRLSTDSNYTVPPYTDGINVISMRQVNDSNLVMLFPSTGGQVTLGKVYYNLPWVSHRDIDANNGYVAFPTTDQFQTIQIWARTPAAALSQVSFFSTRSFMDGLGPNGEVVFRHDTRRFLSSPPYQVVPPVIGSTLGTAFWRAGKAYVLLGRTLFLVN